MTRKYTWTKQGRESRRKRNKKQWSSPEFREKISKTMRKRMLKFWKNIKDRP